MSSLTSTPPRPEKVASGVRAPAALESRPGTWEQYRESQADIEELKGARRVEALKDQSANYFALDSTTTPSPVRTTRPPGSSHLTPTSTSRATLFVSPGTQLADQLARMSLGDSVGASGTKGRNGAAQNRGNGGKAAASTVAGETSASGGPVTQGLSNGAAGGLAEGGDAQSTAEKPDESSQLRRPSSVDELALLVISSSMTELSMAIQEVNTMIFEIQELRHTTMPIAEAAYLQSEAVGAFPPLRPSDSISNAPSELSLPPAAGSSDASLSTESSSDRAPTALSQVDAALMRLDAKLEVVGKEFTDLEAQISPILDASAGQDQADFLRRKWVATAAEWEGAQKDADILGEELKEDKWLTVFRSVSSQAEDMMKSLEKVLLQSHTFIWDLNRRQAKSSAGSASASEAPHQLVDSPRTPGGLSLGTSTSSPLGELSSLPSYFSDPSSMQPLLKSFIALRQSLYAKIKYYSPATDRVLKILGKGIADRSTKNGEVLRRYSEMKSRWRNLVDRIGRIEGEMRSVEEMLKEAAGAGAGAELLTPPKAPALSGPPPVDRVSPFRRLASKMTLRSSMPTTSPPSAARPRPSPSPSSPAALQPKSRPSTAPAQALPTTTPPRPPKSASRYGSVEPVDTLATLPRLPPSPGHRYSQSVNVSASGSASNLAASSRSRRAPSPAPSADGYNKPRWNISTKRPDEKETLRESHLSVLRPSLGGYGTPSRSLTPGASERQSVSGRRSSSRMSLSQSQSFGRGSIGGNRAPSPAFSNFSDASSYARERPMTPSRIPAPSPSTSSRFHASGAFSSLLGDEEPTSLLQRAMSPTPSTSAPPHLSLSPSPTRPTPSPSRLPTPSSSSLHPPRGVSPSLSSTSSTYLARGQTPEPRLMAQANRLSFVRAPHSRPPLTSTPSRDSTSTPKGSRRPSLSRPPSSLSFRPSTQTTSAPPSQPYSPNPLDPLDQHVAAVVNSLPILLYVERLDPPVTRATAGEDANLSARYLLALGTLDQRRAILCKLVDRVGPRGMKGAKKVLVRVGGGYQDLEAYAFGVMAASL